MAGVLLFLWLPASPSLHVLLLPMGVLFPYEVVQAALGTSSKVRPKGNMKKLSEVLPR